MESGGWIVLGVGVSGFLFFFLLFRSMIKNGEAEMFPGGFSWSWRGKREK